MTELQRQIKRYKDLEIDWKQEKDAPTKKALGKELKSLNKSIAKLQARNLSVGVEIAQTHDVQVSVFERSGCYLGPTSWGTSLGDGNYWRNNFGFE